MASQLPPACRPALLVFVLVAAVPSSLWSQRPPRAEAPAVRPVTGTEAPPIVARLDGRLPASLDRIAPAERAANWASWMESQREALAQRLEQGEIDSIVNLLLFGTSFTRAPRITASLLRDLSARWESGDASARETLGRSYEQRVSDLLLAAAAPGPGTRLEEVRGLLARHGHVLSSDAGRQGARRFLFEHLTRVRGEAAALAAELEQMRGAADASAVFAQRSRVFRTRGLSADSSVLTQFAVDRAVCALVADDLLRRNSVLRVAVVGPGLDFTDKQEGFDFYEPQSLQPFTLVDSLRRCELAAPRPVTVITLDVNPRVNRHLSAAVERAGSGGAPYRLVFPWSDTDAADELARRYWSVAGTSIGKAAAAPKATGLPVQARAVSVSPDVVRHVSPVAANIVFDRLELVPAQRFDLVLATNVLVYYDTFEQSLALAGMAAMLRPGGVLLTNDAVLELPEIPVRSAGYTSVTFSTRSGDGERMVRYVRTSAPLAGPAAEARPF